MGHEVRLSWEKWAREVCPSSDSSDDYVQTHEFYVPLESFYYSDAVVEITSWDLEVRRLTFEDPDFTLPTELALCLPSVTCRFNRNPPPSRVYTSNDAELKINRERFKERTKDYYSVYLSTSFTVQGLVSLLRQRVDSNGLISSTSGTKGKLISKLQQGDLAFISNYFKKIISCDMYYIQRELTRYITSFEELDAEVSSFEFLGVTTALTRRQFRQLNVGCSLGPEIIDYFMRFYSFVDNDYFESHRDVNQGSNDYIPYEKSYFVSSQFLLAMEQSNGGPCDNEMQMISSRKLFIPFNLRDIFEHGRDLWCLLIVDFNSKIVFLLDSKNEISGVFVAFTNRVLTIFRTWFSGIITRGGLPGDYNLLAWKCTTLPQSTQMFDVLECAPDSGVFILIATQFIMHFTPLTFTQDNMNVFRIVLCDQILRCLPGLRPCLH
jgi:hypothetical protein